MPRVVQRGLRLDVDPPGGEAARAVDVQLEAVAGDVADRLEWEALQHARELGSMGPQFIGLQ